jgi:hypothetical protein
MDYNNHSNYLILPKVGTNNPLFKVFLSNKYNPKGINQMILELPSFNPLVLMPSSSATKA